MNAALETIKDLMPNEQLLNFHSGTPTLPSWLPSELSLIMGAGDFDQEGLNVDMFHMFDVFYCLPEDSNGSLRRNVERLLSAYPKHIICFINHEDRGQRRKFVNLFKGRFKYIDGYANHTPHFDVNELEELLIPGGQAVNIDEPSEMVVPEDTIYRILFEKPLSTPLTLHEIDLIRGSIQTWSNIDTEQLKIYKIYIYNKLMKEAFNQKRIDIKGIFPIDQTLSPKNALRTVIEYYYLFKKYAPLLPSNMKGELKPFQRPWLPFPSVTFVLTKVAQEGGSKKRKTRKSRKTRKTYRK